MSSYPIIEPITIVETNTYVSFNITNLLITPFVQATMVAQCFTADGKIGNSQFLIMSGNDYSNWNGSDQYLIDWVNTQLHLNQ